MEAQLERHPGVLVLRVKGDLRLWNRPESKEKLLETFRSGLEDRPAQLVLSLHGLTYVDTQGISALIRVLLDCCEQKIGLKIVMPQGMAGEALRCIRIFEPWPRFEDEAAALRAAGV